MSRQKSYRYFAADFETTVYKGQTFTEVWASAFCELETEDVKIFGSIDETFDYFSKLNGNIVLYYHNLKFDGAFWLSYLIYKLQYKQAVIQFSSDENDITFEHTDDMENKTFKYLISEMGQWYTITIKVNDKLIEIRDSLKLLPFTLREIGESFKTKHQKLEMEYEGLRYANCEITDEEKEYIRNDVLVLKEALEIMFKDGHKKLTIGGCCLDEFKCMYSSEWDTLFPNVYDMKLDSLEYGSKNVDEYIRRSYKGGWCYVVKGKENKIYENGITADVNSLYPSMMHSESGNKYPIGKPTFWKGNYIPDEAQDEYHYYFLRIKTRFYLKENKLPCIQIKGDFRYRGTEWLSTSDIYHSDGKYCNSFIDFDGRIEEAYVVLTVTETDYKLIQEQYQLIDTEILDGCYFFAEVGIFDTYIDKYKKIKLEESGAKKQEAKLFLNNLYGRMAISADSSFKYAYLREDFSLGFLNVAEYNKKTCYIPIGSAITSYARNFTIRAAQLNYYGVNKRGFIYADTDSIHCDLTADEVKGIKVDAKNFCCWKLEAYWDKAIFARQKSYIEHVIAKDQEYLPYNKQFYNIKCAGMSEECKKLLNWSLDGVKEKDKKDYDKLSDSKKKFVDTKRKMTDFKSGLKIEGKLVPKMIQGGVILVETEFTMR